MSATKTATLPNKTAILSIIQFYVERHFGRGFSNQRLRRPGRSARRATLIPTEETS